jgi:hypothetical protein
MTRKDDDILEIITGIITIAFLLWIFFGFIFPAFCSAGVKLLCGI